MFVCILIIDNLILLFQKIFDGPEYAKGVPTSYFIHYSPDKLVYSIPELIQYAVPKHSM